MTGTGGRVINFTVIISRCNFSAEGLLHLITGKYGNDNIVSFRELNEFDGWCKRIRGDVSLKLYIMISANFNDVQGFDCLISSSDMLKKNNVFEVIILNEARLLPDLFVSICYCYGWKIINIYKLPCVEIINKIIELERMGGGRNDIILTHREYLVLGYLLKGLTLREINRIIDVNMKTTYTFCTNLKKKLGVMSTCKVYDYRNIINKAITNGIIRLK
ncbi:LuxR C-terminal-related transcriptional regulator [Trabulsiella odontotermitis]|uniref:LuxR C-terminal-related transcriptional regulator n=1 Tax=Trabulsiella odontotermitis TaxID=379893 RepID=UPI001364CFFB|nr:LuxR C-terminal-related transcriptional regulator [Trabulsiella odontotermitis]